MLSSFRIGIGIGIGIGEKGIGNLRYREQGEQLKRIARWLKTPLIPGEAGTIQWKSDLFVDLSTTQKRTHILTGDIGGGGHLWPGKPGKSVFPQSWDGDKIMHEVSGPLVGRDEEIDSLIEDHGEYGVALESLLSLIEEKRVPIPKQQFDKIFELSKLMDFEEELIAYYLRVIEIVENSKKE